MKLAAAAVGAGLLMAVAVVGACSDEGETTSLTPSTLGTSSGAGTSAAGGGNGGGAGGKAGASGAGASAAAGKGGGAAGKGGGAAGKSGGGGNSGAGAGGAAGAAGSSAGAGIGGAGGVGGNVAGGSAGSAGSGGTGGSAGSGGTGSNGGVGGNGGTSGSGGGASGMAGSSGGSSGSGGACNPVEEARALEGADHVTACTFVDYVSNPPSSGNHYPVPTQHRTYTTPVVRGFWVHNLEHGGIVFSYNCPDGCAAELAMLQTIIDDAPVDPLCLSAGTARRVLMTPDPHLDVRFAASAWGFVLRSDCMNPQAFSAFLTAHYAMGPEQVCWDGPDQSLGQPDGCGEPGFVPDGG